MKTKEELTALKEEFEALNKRLAELSEDELSEVTGGFVRPVKEVKPDGEETDGFIPIPF